MKGEACASAVVVVAALAVVAAPSLLAFLGAGLCLAIFGKKLESIDNEH